MQTTTRIITGSEKRQERRPGTKVWEMEIRNDPSYSSVRKQKEKLIHSQETEVDYYSDSQVNRVEQLICLK